MIKIILYPLYRYRKLFCHKRKSFLFNSRVFPYKRKTLKINKDKIIMRNLNVEQFPGNKYRVVDNFHKCIIVILKLKYIMLLSLCVITKETTDSFDTFCRNLL